MIALLAGCALAWIDTRPNWDDTGVMAGLLFVAATVVALLGLPWWIAALLVAGPLIGVELRALGVGLLLPLGLAALGSLLGRSLHRAGSRREHSGVDS